MSWPVKTCHSVDMSTAAPLGSDIAHAAAAGEVFVQLLAALRRLIGPYRSEPELLRIARRLAPLTKGFVAPGF